MPDSKGRSPIDYTRAAQTYDHTRTHSDAVINRFNRVVAFRTTTTVLDFGCGTGNYLARIRERFGSRCFGVDPSEAMRSKALEKCPSLQVESGNHTAIPFDSSRFDFSYMTDVIHHVADHVAMFAELERVLKPGGCLCVVTQTHEQIERRFYNRYFPSLCDVETRRYPDTSEILAASRAACLEYVAAEATQGAPREVNDDFILNVKERNWSMFRLLPEAEFQRGLASLELDRGKSFVAPGAGDTYFWFRKTGGR